MSHLLGGSIVELLMTSSKRTYGTCRTSQDCCSQSPCPHGRSLSTRAASGDTESLIGRSGSVSCGDTVSFSWLLVHIRFCFVPSKGLFPQSCGSSVIKSLWPQKSNSLGVLSLFAGSPRWDICGSMVGLMATSSKGAYATHCVTQVYCTQRPCP